MRRIGPDWHRASSLSRRGHSKFEGIMSLICFNSIRSIIFIVSRAGSAFEKIKMSWF